MGQELDLFGGGGIKKAQGKQNKSNFELCPEEHAQNCPFNSIFNDSSFVVFGRLWGNSKQRDARKNTLKYWKIQH